MIGKALFLNWWQKRRLVGKHTAILIAVTLTIMPATFALVWLSSRVAFLDLERKNVAAQVARAEQSIRLFEVSLSKSLGDYADWDDSYAYLNSPTQVFENSTLNPHTMKNMGVDVITYVRFDGKTMFARAVNNATEQILAGESANFARYTSSGAFLAAAKAKKNHLAYVRTKRGLYVLYSQWQSDSEGKAVPKGFLVMGNLLGTQMLSDALQTDVVLNLRPAQDVASKLNVLSNKSFSETRSQTTSSAIGVFGQDKKLLATIDFETPRNLIKTGRKALLAILAALMAGIAMMILMLSVGIRKISVERLQKIERFVRDYRSDAKLAPGLTEGADEVASLASAFERLTGELHQAEEQLRQSSYLQGKADSAAGMLHNVRNSLAPIRVMQDKWLAEETLPFRANLQRAAQELTRDDIDPARKADLERFMLSAARQIALSSEGRLREMEETRVSINQIADILGSYDFDMSGKRSGEEISLPSLLTREAATVAARDSGGFELILPDDLPAIIGNRIQFAQVIGNIFVNADEAMVSAGTAHKQVVVNWRDTGEGMVELRFTDSGDGIAAEDIERAFHRGYSTREHKSGGLGMHWAANAMRAMGGSIALESEGLGKGATAIVIARLAHQSEIRQAA
jgi:two-component system, OmpR family, sensor kinase